MSNFHTFFQVRLLDSSYRAFCFNKFCFASCWMSNFLYQLHNHSTLRPFLLQNLPNRFHTYCSNLAWRLALSSRHYWPCLLQAPGYLWEKSPCCEYCLLMFTARRWIKDRHCCVFLEQIMKLSDWIWGRGLICFVASFATIEFSYPSVLRYCRANWNLTPGYLKEVHRFELQFFSGSSPFKSTVFPQILEVFVLKLQRSFHLLKTLSESLWYCVHFLEMPP